MSALSLGTVSLGVEYGIAAPGEFGRPNDAEAIALLRAAVERGVTLIDTAPAYGESERLVGEAIGADPRVIVATKVSAPVGSGSSVGSGFSRTCISSIEASLRALGRDVLDIVQIHNATRALIEEGAAADALLDAQRRGLIRVLGASVYGEAAARAAIRSGHFGLLQVAFNVIDQRMAATVLPAAEAAGVGVLVRSALLKGALTPKAQWLPASLASLQAAATRARDVLAGGAWEPLPAAALRFCLSEPHVASVLTGARTLAELDAAISAEAAGPLDATQLSAARALAIDDERLVDPRQWPPL